MQMRAFSILTVLASLNLAVFGICYALAAEDTGASFAGLFPAMIAYVSLFASALLTAFGWNQMFLEIRLRCVGWKAVLSTVLAATPLLFFLFFDVIPHKLTRRHSQQPNNSLQTTADGAFNLTIESLVFKCRSSAVFEVGR